MGISFNLFYNGRLVLLKDVLNIVGIVPNLGLRIEINCRKAFRVTNSQYPPRGALRSGTILPVVHSTQISNSYIGSIDVKILVCHANGGSFVLL